jgi:hypothetical protein
MSVSLNLNTRKICSSVLGAGVLALAVALTGCGGTSSNTQAQTASHTGEAPAWAVCQSAVKQRLSNPAAVQFLDETSTGTSYGFKFIGEVSVHTSSGNKVTQHYVCSADENGSSGWIAEGVTLS